MQQLEAISRRMHEQDTDFYYYQELLNRMKAGFAGERQVDFEWFDMKLPMHYFLLNNFELQKASGYVHQMDTVFICQHFIFVLEIKNIKGTVDFDEEISQFTRTTAEGHMEGFRNAIDQVSRHARQLQHILDQFEITLPIEYAVVLSNPTTIVKRNNSKLPVFHLSALEKNILQYYQKHNKAILTKQELKILATKLKAIHQPRESNLRIDLNRLNLTPICNECKTKTYMIFYHGKYRCKNCGNKNQQPFFLALNDYLLLVNEKISNQQLRSTFSITSRSVTTNLLAKMKWDYIGSYKNRKYIIPENILKQ